MPTTAHELTLKRRGLSALVVVVVELTVSQLLTAMKAPDTASAKSVQAEAAAINQEVLRMSLREIGGEAVSYDKLEGRELRARLGGRVRHVVALSVAAADFYAPTRDEREAIKDGAAIREEDLDEIWAVTLPDGRKVELAEVAYGTLGEALGEAEALAKTAAAAKLLQAIGGLRRSIRSIDGRTVSAESLKGKATWDRLFSVKETRLLDYVHSLIHGGEEEFEVGEAKPQSGTA